MELCNDFFRPEVVPKGRPNRLSQGAMRASEVPPGTIFYHGTKADLVIGELIGPGHGSNFVERQLKHIYFSATLDAATWGAELARGAGHGRVYIVEPTGPFEDDPNLTDKKFPGNVTASYRSLDPLRITGEVEDWVGHSPEQLQAMRDGLQRLKEQGADKIED
jgi:rifampin ADP-ribosylating transferase